MAPDEIEIGRTYIGGKHGTRRTVLRHGSERKWLIWADTETRLPLGEFVHTRCTGRYAFARWADREDPDEPLYRRS